MTPITEVLLAIRDARGVPPHDVFTLRADFADAIEAWLDAAPDLEPDEVAFRIVAGHSPGEDA